MSEAKVIDGISGNLIGGQTVTNTYETNNTKTNVQQYTTTYTN